MSLSLSRMPAANDVAYRRLYSQRDLRQGRLKYLKQRIWIAGSLHTDRQAHEPHTVQRACGTAQAGADKFLRIRFVVNLAAACILLFL